MSLTDQVPGTGQRLDDALLAPTRVYVKAAEDALKSAGEQPVRIGTVIATPGRTVSIPAAGLRGSGDTFAHIS
jgi:hypothetical protein